MKFIFAGTPEFAVLPLQTLCENGFLPVAVLTQPDRPQGRKGILTPSPVKKFALERGIPVLQPEKLKTDFSALKAAGATCMITCAYGQILTKEVLSLFEKGVWNIHASLLPAYRGASPISAAIWNEEKTTGVTIMKTDVGLDTGDILLREEIEISPRETCGSLTEKLSALGAKMILEALPAIESGEYTLEKQGEGATLTKKTVRTELDFSRPAHEVSALVRALSPSPLAFGRIGGLILNFYNAEVVADCGGAPSGTVLSANPKTGFVVACKEGAIKITELQPAGGKRMSARDFLNGRKIAEGMKFDEPLL